MNRRDGWISTTPLTPTQAQRDLILSAEEMPGAYLDDLFDVETIMECRRNGWIRLVRGASLYATKAGLIAVAASE